MQSRNVVNINERKVLSNFNNNLIDVNVYKSNGSSVEHFDIDFLIDLFNSVSIEKNFNCNLDNLKNIQCDSMEKCVFLANELSYRFMLFSKFLVENSLNDYDWFCSFRTDDDRFLKIYGVNSVISKIRNGILLYCQRVLGNNVKEYFLNQLDLLEVSHNKVAILK